MNGNDTLVRPAVHCRSLSTVHYLLPSLPMPSYIISANPDYLLAALDEMRALDRDVRSTLEYDGVAVVESSLDLPAMHARLESRPPVFVRHIQPAETRELMAGTGEDLSTLARAVMRLPSLALIEEGTPFAVQARVIAGTGALRPYTPYAVKDAIVPLVTAQTGAVEEVRNPVVVISVLALKEVGFVGISPVAFNLSDWSGGMRRFARTNEQLSRAEFKLLEALDLFDVALPREGKALDLGASPGGWTRVLRDQGLTVLAVDPAPLDAALMEDEGVRYLHGYAQEWVDRFKSVQEKFDVVVSDMRMDARDAARFMVDAAPLMHLRSAAVLTLKLPPPGTPGLNPVALVREALEELRSRFRVVRARQLFHNRHEVTVYLEL
jgi:23S rRNA (cytidine2498-2'-O)-methyltransferase